jgi:hypothetical protein
MATMNDILTAVQAATTMAERTKRVVCIMPDLSVVFETDYTRERAVEIVHPTRLR